jgi:ubiquinone/menaquinone biosynthesis C-methylase UbiE
VFWNQNFQSLRMQVPSLTAERLSANGIIPRWVRHEHTARYEFAAQFVENDIVVDCACGTGKSAVHFVRAGARHIHAFDVSELSVREAREYCKSTAVTFEVRDALQLPLPDESADVFVSLETIEHIDDDAAFIKEIARILKPNGLLICSTPNREITNPGLQLTDQPFNRFHVREYSTSEFSKLLAAQFGEVTMYGQNLTRHFYAKTLASSAKLVGSRAVSRVNQLLKLPRFLYYDPAYASVVRIKSGLHYEYLVAVCRKL